LAYAQTYPERVTGLVLAAITTTSHSDINIQKAAALAWCKWEDVHPSLDPNYSTFPDFKDVNFSHLFATLVIHYWHHHGFLKENEILSQMHLLKNIPGVLIHGRYDVSSPMRTAWDLHKAWPSSRMIVIAEEGQGGPEDDGSYDESHFTIFLKDKVELS